MDWAAAAVLTHPCDGRVHVNAIAIHGLEHAQHSSIAKAFTAA